MALYRPGMTPKRFPILFITASRIGDAVLSSGLIKALVEQIPNARFTIVAGPLAAPLFVQTPRLDRVIVMEKRAWGGHWYSLWQRVRGRRWGLIVDLRGSSISRMLMRQRRAVYKSGGPVVHKVVEAARLLKLEGEPPTPTLYTSEDIETHAAALTCGEGPILAIGPGTNWVGKTWPTERFSQVVRALLGPGGPLEGGRLMILGGPEDRGLGVAVRGAVTKDRLIELAGKTDLLTAFAVLKHARLYIGGDSGLMHMAAAAGTPTLGLFGPSDERLYAPWGPATRVVRGPRSFDDIRERDPHLNHAVCHMMDLSVPRVVAAAKALIADTAPGASHDPDL